jgi:hypothetical protein
MVDRVNPYSNSRNENEFDTPDYAAQEYHSYAAPNGNAPYGLPGNPFSTSLEYSPDATPDPYRLQREPIHDARQNASQPKKWWKRNAIDRDARESVQHQSGIQEETQTSLRFAPNPGATRPANNRWLQGTSPNTYSFTRPFTGMTPHRFNGVHFSMADHRRYPNEVYGMAAAKQPRMTYRADIGAVSWGEQVIDKGTAIDYTVDETYEVEAIPNVSNRAYRLG